MMWYLVSAVIGYILGLYTGKYEQKRQVKKNRRRLTTDHKERPDGPGAF